MVINWMLSPMIRKLFPLLFNIILEILVTGIRQGKGYKSSIFEGKK